jgi:2Fe-2S ferredoxin
MTDEPQLPRVTFIDSDGDSLTVAARAGDTVMQTARRVGIPGVRAECGGYLKCGTCHVYVEDAAGELPPLTEDEEEMLQGVAAGRRANSRLSCQLTIDPESDLRVTIPTKQI